MTGASATGCHSSAAPQPENREHRPGNCGVHDEGDDAAAIHGLAIAHLLLAKKRSPA